jgi:hypothetical protein
MTDAATILREAVYEAIDSAEKALRSGELCGWELEVVRKRVTAWADAQKAAPPAAQPAGSTGADSDYRRMFGAAVASLAEISEALGIDEEKAACANGNELILEAISILAAKAQNAPQPRTAEPALSMKRHEWDSLSPEARKLIHDRTREHTLESARAAQAIRDTPLAEPAPAPADEPPPLPEPAWMTQLCGRDPHYFYTADQMRARDAYWIAKLQAERSKP